MGNTLSDSKGGSGSALLGLGFQQAEQEESALRCQLLELDDMRLWQLHWLLGQEWLLDLLALPPIPQLWLLPASPETTYKLLLRCYHSEGTTRVLKAGLGMLDQVHLSLHHKEVVKHTLAGLGLGPVLGLPKSQDLNLIPVLKQSEVLDQSTDSDPSLVKNKHQKLVQQVQTLEPVQIFGEVLDVDPGLVKNQRGKLVQQVERLDKVLELLLQRGVLTTFNMEAILVFGLQQHKTRALLDLLIQKGDQAQQIFLQALGQLEPFLLLALVTAGPGSKMSTFFQSDSSWLKPHPHHNCLFSYFLSYFLTDSSASCMCVQTKDFLDREELDLFRWVQGGLVTDHSGGEGVELPVGETLSLLLKIAPTFSVHLPEVDKQEKTSQEGCGLSKTPVIMDAEVQEVTPEVTKDGNFFRLHCRKPGVFRCSATGLQLEGAGELLYGLRPWNLDFLRGQGLQPAGPLFSFTILSGSFQRLYLPHSCVLTGGRGHFLSVAHVTGTGLELLPPEQVTVSHVSVVLPGFSCFGLVQTEASRAAQRARVFVFRKRREKELFLLLLPNNINLDQVIQQCRRRSQLDFVETSSECQLVPQQTYQLRASSGHVHIQPEICTFVNDSSYHNFLPSFHILLPADVWKVELRLRSYTTSLPLIGWLLGDTDIWCCLINLGVPDYSQTPADLQSSALELLAVLEQMTSDDLGLFHSLLSKRSDPVPAGRLEAADRRRTVDLLLQQYQAGGAREVTQEILEKMNLKVLANQLFQ